MNFGQNRASWQAYLQKINNLTDIFAFMRENVSYPNYVRVILCYEAKISIPYLRLDLPVCSAINN